MRRIIRSLNKKNYNRGFTLIELLAIITIISFVMVVTGNIVVNIINNSQQKTLEMSKQNILKSAVNYIRENEDIVWTAVTDMNSKDEISCVSIQELINEGYFDEKILKNAALDDVKSKFVVVRRNTLNKTIVSEKYDDINNSVCQSSFQYVEQPSCFNRIYNAKKQILINSEEENKYKFENNEGLDAKTYDVKISLSYGYVWKNGRRNEIIKKCNINPAPILVTFEPEVIANTIRTKTSFDATPVINVSKISEVMDTDDIIKFVEKSKDVSGKINAISSNREYMKTNIENSTGFIGTKTKIDLIPNSDRIEDTEINVTFTPNNSNYSKGNGILKVNSIDLFDIFNVTLDANGGTFKATGKKSETFNVIENQTYGDKINNYVVKREGYTFKGWYTDKNAGNKVDSNTKILNKSHTLYAKWEVNKYEVSYISNKYASINETVKDLKISYDYNTSYLTLNGKIDSNTKLMLANEVFSKNSKYKVTLSYISGKYTASDYNKFVTEVKGKNGKNLSTRNNLDLSFPKSGSISGILKINSSSVSNGQTLYSWIYCGNETVKFNNYIVKVVITKVDTKEVTYDSNYGDFPNVSRPGYIKENWYSNDDWKKVIKNNTKVTTAKDHEVYLKWSPIKYTIKYNCNGGDGITESSRHKFNEYKKLTSNSCSKEEYDFSGWSTTSNGSIKYFNNQNVINLTTVGNKTIDLYAVWKPRNHTVKYDLNGGQGTFEEQTKVRDVELILRNSIPTKTGYYFKGWNTQKDGNGTSYNPGGKYTYDQYGGTVTLYAQWSAKTVTVSFNDPSGVNSPKTTTYTYGTANQAFDSGFSRTGYTASGWSTTKGGEFTYSFTSGVTDDWINSNADKTVNLYVIWSAKTVTVSFNDPSGVNSSKTTTYTYGTANQVFDSGFSRTGYTAAGWAESNGGGVVYSFTSGVADSWITSNAGKTVNLYAVWTINKVNVQFNTNGGTLQASTNAAISAGSNGYVLYNGSTIVKTYDYNKNDIDLPGTGNVNFINITKVGYNAKSKAQWIKSGSSKTYNASSKKIKATDLCNATNGSCTVTLNVNWIDNIAPTFTKKKCVKNRRCSDGNTYNYAYSYTIADAGSGLNTGNFNWNSQGNTSLNNTSSNNYNGTQTHTGWICVSKKNGSFKYKITDKNGNSIEDTIKLNWGSC